MTLNAYPDAAFALDEPFRELYSNTQAEVVELVDTPS